jgi:MYXO-CTERM domain-containing protein
MGTSYSKLWILPLMGSALLVGPRPASACGGTFCDSGPTAMPVDQTGENVLFVMDAQTVEAHVQIQYQGEAAKFAWIVPMPKVPTVTVGSQPLFSSLLSSTVPSYGFSQTFDQCGTGGGAGAGGFPGGGMGGAGGAGGGINADSGGPTVVFKKTVGAFEVTALQGGTAEEVSTWLSTNGYQSIPSAPAILKHYVELNFVFVAIKLTGGAGVDEIHPLVFKYQGNEPCVPLKLTAVAAVEDMGVRVFFLGDDRVFPTNYKHVELNPARLDWQTRGANYTQLVNRAVDSAVANGQAFITEYAGPSSVVGANNTSIYDPIWSEAPFVTIQPENVITELGRQRLAFCSTSTCLFNHPLVLPLLQQYLPAPAGVQENTFYGSLPQYALQIDRLKWQGAAFATDFKNRIVDPGKHARDIVNRWPYLTRMFTALSPAEMTLDPIFHARADLSNQQVNNRTVSARRRTACNGRSAMILPDSREVALAPPGTTWPVFSSAMPWAERIEEVPLTGAVIELVDNTEVIDRELAAWNLSQGWPPFPSGSMGSGGQGGTASGGAGAAGGRGGRGGAGANAAAGGSFPGDGEPAVKDEGCSCGLIGADGDGEFWLAAGAAALAWLRRRRRKALPQPLP